MSGPVGYLGPAGTFCHQALQSMGVEHGRPFASVIAALDAVRTGQVASVLVPIENSVEGGVSATIDNLTHSEVPLMITGEVTLPVQFSLVARRPMELAEVRTVATHPHASAQCRRWLADHVPGATISDTSSTAAAAAEVAASDRFDAAICAAVAGDMHHLVRLADQIADNREASTRFVLVSRLGPAPEPTGHDKTTLVVFIHADRPGALMQMLQQFDARGVNLTRLESRPTRETLGRYCFSIDCEGHIADDRVAEALMGLRRTAKDVVFLGSYASAGGVEPDVLPGFTAPDFRAARAWLAGLRASDSR